MYDKQWLAPCNLIFFIFNHYFCYTTCAFIVFIIHLYFHFFIFMLEMASLLYGKKKKSFKIKKKKSSDLVIMLMEFRIK